MLPFSPSEILFRELLFKDPGGGGFMLRKLVPIPKLVHPSPRNSIPLFRPGEGPGSRYLLSKFLPELVQLPCPGSQLEV